MTVESRSFDITVFPKLRDEEAIDALRDFIRELERQKGKDLTEKQTKALIKFTWGLISSIETRKQRDASDKELRRRWLGEKETEESELRWLRYIFAT